jgi:hypothetical protein
MNVSFAILLCRDRNRNCVRGWSNSSQSVDQVGPKSIAEEHHQ